VTLSQFIERLQKLKDAGNGELPVYARHGASGDCSKVGSPHVTAETDGQGPFDVKGEYISIYVGS
jgi:hypothetical protein